MSDPAWISTANPNAMVNLEEVKQWLKVNQHEMKALCERQAFPLPRFNAGRGSGLRLTKSCRWRVGDIRAWLKRQEIDAESQLKIGPRVYLPRDERDRREAADQLWIKSQ